MTRDSWILGCSSDKPTWHLLGTEQSMVPMKILAMAALLLIVAQSYVVSGRPRMFVPTVLSPMFQNVKHGCFDRALELIGSFSNFLLPKNSGYFGTTWISPSFAPRWLKWSSTFSWWFKQVTVKLASLPRIWSVSCASCGCFASCESLRCGGSLQVLGRDLGPRIR